MKTLDHILTEAILDYEDELWPMNEGQRESYEPRARQRARFLADRLREAGVVVVRATRHGVDCSCADEPEVVAVETTRRRLSRRTP